MESNRIEISMTFQEFFDKVAPNVNLRDLMAVARCLYFLGREQEALSFVEFFGNDHMAKICKSDWDRGVNTL